MKSTLFLAAVVGFLGFAAADVEDEIAGEWEDNEMTTQIWRAMFSQDLPALQTLIEADPKVVQMRSSDGRGALFWAYEYGNDDAVKFLIRHGADEDAKDVNDLSPRDMIAVGEANRAADDEDEEEDEDEDDDYEDDEE